MFSMWTEVEVEVEGGGKGETRWFLCKSIDSSLLLFFWFRSGFRERKKGGRRVPVPHSFLAQR